MTDSNRWLPVLLVRLRNLRLDSLKGRVDGWSYGDERTAAWRRATS